VIASRWSWQNWSRLQKALFISLAFHGALLTLRIAAPERFDRLFSDAPLDVILVNTRAKADAPEKAQPFGQVGKQRLSEICYNKHATVAVVNTDRYGRTVGDVTCDSVHANAEMVSGGNAWVYRHYDKGFEFFYGLEKAAKEAKLGLWADDNPTPPWEWRHSRKRKD